MRAANPSIFSISRIRARRVGPLWFFVLLWAAAAPAQNLSLDLTARLRYDGDRDGSDWDSTLYSNLSITDIIKNRLDLKISGYGLWDLDGNDAFDRALDQRSIRISEAYVDLRNIGALSRLRLGRQYLREVDYLRLDGASATFMENKPISFFIFGGREVSYYRSARDDWAGGGGMIWKPSWRTKHQLDAYVLHENDNYFLASAWRWNQYWGNYWRTTSRLRFMDGGVRDYRFHLSKFFEAVGIGMDLDYFLQPRRRGVGDQAYTRSLSTYGRVLGPSPPNHRLALDLNKYFAERWLVQLGGSIRRRFEDERDEPFNSIENESAHLSVTRFNTLIKNLDVTLAGEYIHNRMDNMAGVTGQVGYRPAKAWDLSAGLSYTRYRFDPIDFDTKMNGQNDIDLLLEDLRIPVYFFEARWKPSKTFDVRGEVNWEDTNDLRGNGLSARLTLNYHLRKSFAPRDGESNPVPAGGESKRPEQP